MPYEITDARKVANLFGEWEETLIWSCLQGVMGKIYANDLQQPTAAMAVIGDFTFFAGKPDPALAAYKPAWCKQNYMILVPQNERWQEAILQAYGDRAKLVSRYATKKEPGIFDLQKLKQAVASLPEGYSLFPINERLYHLCKAEAWSADLVSLFPSAESYNRLGIGVVICHHDQLVAGASSYSRYRGGIEIEIDTKREYRRQGLAYICGAKLILDCLARDLYPSWDAHNPASIALAQKLGYHYSHTYTAIEIEDD